jgi:hypothetical protein
MPMKMHESQPNANVPIAVLRVNDLRHRRWETIAAIADFLHPLGYRATKSPQARGSVTMPLVGSDAQAVSKRPT